MKLNKKIVTGLVVATSFASLSLPAAPVFAESVTQQTFDAAKKSDQEAHEQGFMNHRGGKLGKQKAVKVLSNKKIKSKTAYLAYGGNIYSNRYLSYSKAYVSMYIGPKFTINRQEVVRKANGKKAVYYHITNSQITGWVWHKNTKAHLS